MSSLKIFKNSAVYGIGTFLINTTGFLLIPFYTRFLTTEDYGIVSTLGVLITVLTTLYFLGQDSSVSRFFFDYKDELRRRRYFSSIWFFMIFLCLTASILLSIFGKPIFKMIFKEIDFNPYGIIVIWTCFFSFFESIPMAILRAEEKALKFSLINYVSFIVKVGLLIYFIAFLKRGALGKIQADLIWATLFGIFFIVLMRKYITLNFSFTNLKSSLRFGLPLVPHDLSLWALNLADRLIMQHMLSFKAVGIYSLGYNLPLMLNFISNSIGKAWTPHFFGNAEKKDARTSYARMSTYYALLMVSAGLFLAVFSRELIVLLSQPDYYEAAKVVPIVAAAYILHSLYKVNCRILHYVKKTNFIGYSTVSSAILNLTLNFILIKRMGMIGAAWATFISFVFLLVITFYYSQIFYKVKFEAGRLLKVSVAAVVLYFLSNFVRSGNLGLDIFIKLLIFTAFPISLFAMRFLYADEKDKIRLLVSNRKYFLDELFKKRHS